MRPLVILDRDGVINQDSSDYIRSPAEWRALPGSLDAMARLTRAGYDIAVATNQSGLARGYFDEATLEAIHAKMRAAIEAAGGRINAVHYCPHGPDDDCDCRKPKPGLFHQISEAFGRSLSGVAAIGDSRRDLEAALIAGAAPILVRSGNGRKTEAGLSGELASVPVFDDLAAAVTALLGPVR